MAVVVVVRNDILLFVVIVQVERRMSGIPRECPRYEWLRSHKSQRTQLEKQLGIDQLLERNVRHYIYSYLNK